MGTRNGVIHIGTSGWNYPHWKRSFYPEELAQERWLAYYAERLGSVEINNSFYQLPSEQTFSAWKQQVPPGFVFAVKASRYITHMKKLKDPADSLGLFLGRIAALGEKLGPVLFQLPPRWRRNAERLSAFVGQLPSPLAAAFEFRDPSWFHPETYEVLARHGAAFCIYHLAGQTSPKEVTADFVYVRLHGPGAAYAGEYDTAALSGWAGALSAWQRQGKAVYCYFDNDQRGYAAANALRLAQMLA
jgi:uncharacterized protein YecE (DUF72 family)